MNKLLVLIGIVAAIVLGVWILFRNTDHATVPAPQTGAVSDPSITIIAFGDSLTAGYGLPQSDAYPQQLETALLEQGHSVKVINAGVSGETTRGNLERAAFIASQEPDIVLLGIGGNDALRALPIAATKENITQTLSILQDVGNPPVILLLAMQAPLNAGFGYKQAFDALYGDIAAEYNITLVPFITARIFLDPDNKLPDGIHYNKTGYSKVVAQYLLPAVEKAIKELR